MLTFLHSNNVNIAAIQESKLTNKSKPYKTPELLAVRLDRHKIKGGGLLLLMRDTIPFVENTAALPQSVDPHLEQQCISTTMPNRQQLHIIYIPPRSSCSAGHNASIAHLLSNNEMSLIVVDINAIHSTWDANKNEYEGSEQLADEIDTADYTILIDTADYTILIDTADYTILIDTADYTILIDTADYTILIDTADHTILIDTADYAILIEDEATRLPSNGRSSLSDIS